MLFRSKKTPLTDFRNVRKGGIIAIGIEQGDSLIDVKLTSGDNDVVLITGCGSGIGKALARAFHRQGRRVCATARKLDAMADLAAENVVAVLSGRPPVTPIP